MMVVFNVNEILKTTALNTVKNPENWINFLQTAANNHKYPFVDQLMIFAQKPDATACASIDVWNKKLKRAVTENATPIYLASNTSNNQPNLAVFDVSDTTGAPGNDIPLWRVRQETNDLLLGLLCDHHSLDGDLSNREVFAKLAAAASEDVFPKILSGLLSSASEISSDLLYRNEGGVAVNGIRELISSSIEYMLLSRCGFEPEDRDLSKFSAISNFNTPEAISILGTNVSNASRSLLNEIALIIKTAEKTLNLNNNLNINKEVPSNDSQTGTIHREVRNDEENVSPEQQGRALFNSDDRREIGSASDGSGAESSVEDRTADETDGGEEQRERSSQGSESDDMGWSDEQHSQQSRGNSSEGDHLRINDEFSLELVRELLQFRERINLGSPDSVIEYFRNNFDEDQRIGYLLNSIYSKDVFCEFSLANGVKAGFRALDEGLEIWTGGNAYPSADRKTVLEWNYVVSVISDLIASDRYFPRSPYPSVEQQQEVIEDLKSNFEISQGDIDAVLAYGSSFHHGKYRIYEQFSKKESAKNNADFLKDEYGVGGGTFIFPDGVRGSTSHDGKGIGISKNRTFSKPDVLLNWNMVQKRIGELIAADRYLSSAEKEYYPEYKKENELRAERLRIAKEFDSIIREYNDFQREHNNQDACLNLYVLTDCSSQFVLGKRSTYTSSSAGDFILPLIRDSLHEIIDSNTPLSDRSKTILEIFQSDFVKDLEPETEELETVEETEKEYRLSLGDKVYVGIDEFEIISLSDDEVCLSDVKFPLFTSTYSFNDLIELLSENRHNNYLLQPVSPYSRISYVWQSYSEIKAKHPDSYLLYQVGDFFEVNGADASRFAELFGLKTTQRHINDDTVIDTCGFPSFELDSYIERLSESGLKFVISSIDNGIRRTSEGVESTDAEPLTVDSAEILPEETPIVLAQNYRIVNDELGVGGPKEKFNRNIAAIKLLHKLESEQRGATAEEQGILAEYVGWGGLSMAFDANNKAWEDEFNELVELLSDDEYRAARESTLSAFYTPPVVIKAIYKALDQMGFKTGNILEPSCGIGNFMGLLPDEMQRSKLYGVELDSISGRIAQKLYPNANIAVQGFEDSHLPDSFFDLAIGNVPFGQFQINDKAFNKHHFMVHDYFFAKTLEKVRPGGIIAFITSKGTMDKKSSDVRRYIAQRAELLGAIRLPNNTFAENAGTEAVSDILFLQKRDRAIDVDPDWVYLDSIDNDIDINSYFTEHPEMILGEMKLVSGPHGPEPTCEPLKGKKLEDQLNKAIENINGSVTVYDIDLDDPIAAEDIPADPNVRNYSFAEVDGSLYFRENSVMHPVRTNKTAEQRIFNLIELRQIVRSLIDAQLNDESDQVISALQKDLNEKYDAFTERYGLINSRGNGMAFSDDSSYYLLCSLEHLDKEGNLERKADMFTKRTIRPVREHLTADSSLDALAISIGEKACVDLEFMHDLTGFSFEKLIDDLRGSIFPNPQHTDRNGVVLYETADEYLSGNVKEKLRIAREYAEQNPDKYANNVVALEQVQPEPLTASEISVRLGATWIPVEVYQKFMLELLEPSRYYRDSINVVYTPYTGHWDITNKTYDRWNVKANEEFGTSRASAYRILEDSLNLKDVVITDTVEDPDGRKRQVTNKVETTIAQQKQQAIKDAFADWVWQDPDRRQTLVNLYNNKFNSHRLREFNGDYILFHGMNPEISLMKHQRDAIARIIYGGNTLLAHSVGAGKTFEMVAAAMESKRLGLCNKNMFVVPNHLTEQWATEILRLYPSANILVATEKDFQTANRKKFCSRIATGDYDAIVIGHSQFERIPLSTERQIAILQDQLDEILDGIVEAKEADDSHITVKQLERSRKSIEARLEKLNDEDRKDDVVTFEELGVDRQYIDEAHYFKNLFLYTKMQNIAGISQSEAKKSSDLFMKTQYMDEKTGNRGNIFATGTPVSNSMVEIYTMQRYLQHDTLVEMGLEHFDSWASTFGETVTAVELAPEGTGYRAKTRFARFYNLPELMTAFKGIADIKTADELDLDVPDVNYHTISVEPSEEQRAIVAEFSKRAKAVRDGVVDSTEDNMLKITNDGRNLALDQRCIDPTLPDFEGSKVNACVENIYNIWEKHKENRLTQLVFCDLSTPHNDGSFSVYDDIKAKLIARGVPEDEIAFIHDAKTKVQKENLFGDVRAGNVRILMGSTQKMGAGTNVQDKLVAMHDLDCPWRPADLEQRSGRIIRQGNQQDEVEIYRYVTKDTFDAYMWQLVENKQKFISQIMTSKTPVRSAEDVDTTALSYAEIKALATGNPLIKEKMDLDIQVSKLKVLKSNFLKRKYAMEDSLKYDIPRKIQTTKIRLEGYENDIQLVNKTSPAADNSISSAVVNGVSYTQKDDANAALREALKDFTSSERRQIGEYRNFKILASYDSFFKCKTVFLKGSLTYKLGDYSTGAPSIGKIDSVLDSAKLTEAKREVEADLDNLYTQKANAEELIKKSFAQEDELRKANERLTELNALLNNDNTEPEISPEESIVSAETSEGALHNDDFSDEQLTVLSDSRFNDEQIEQIKAGFLDGLTVDEVKTYAKPWCSAELMQNLREVAVIEKSVDNLTSQYDINAFDGWQLDEIRQALRNGLSEEQLSVIVDPEISSAQMHDMFNRMLKGEDVKKPLDCVIHNARVQTNAKTTEIHKDITH